MNPWPIVAAAGVLLILGMAVVRGAVEAIAAWSTAQAEAESSVDVAEARGEGTTDAINAVGNNLATIIGMFR